MKRTVSVFLVLLILSGSLILGACDRSSRSKIEFVTVMEILKKKYDKNDTMAVLQDEIKDRGLDMDPDSYVCVLQSGISGDVEIPGEYEGAPVVAAASRKSEYGGMTSLKVSEGIRCLVGICYKDTSSYSLKECRLPENIAVVSCFSDCDCIKELDLSGVSEIKDSFSLCSKLRDLKISSSTKKITGGSFNGCDDLEKLELPGKIEKLSKSFRSCTFLKELSIGDGASGNDEIKEINECFDHCIVLEKLSLNASAGSMTDSFNSLNALKSLTIEKMPDKTDGSFNECKALSEVVFREPVKEINDSFNKNKSLKKVTFEKEAKEISGSFCSCAALTEVSFKARTESVKSSFNGNEALEKVSAPGGFGSVTDSFRDSSLKEAPDELKKAAEKQPEEKTSAGKTSTETDMATFLEGFDPEESLKKLVSKGILPKQDEGRFIFEDNDFVFLDEDVGKKLYAKPDKKFDKVILMNDKGKYYFLQHNGQVKNVEKCRYVIQYSGFVTNIAENYYHSSRGYEPRRDMTTFIFVFDAKTGEIVYIHNIGTSVPGKIETTNIGQFGVNGKVKATEAMDYIEKEMLSEEKNNE